MTVEVAFHLKKARAYEYIGGGEVDFAPCEEAFFLVFDVGSQEGRRKTIMSGGQRHWKI